MMEELRKSLCKNRYLKNLKNGPTKRGKGFSLKYLVLESIKVYAGFDNVNMRESDLNKSIFKSYPIFLTFGLHFVTEVYLNFSN